jgi:ribose-phosphate pyrophosphokinase
MVRNIVLLGGNSHPGLVDDVANILGVAPSRKLLSKFSGGETRCEIQDSVRGKDVYIIQSGSGSVNDNLIELCIMISACKTGSAKRVIAIMPLFPYSRQPDWPYNKAGAPLSQSNNNASRKDYTFESVPATPKPGGPRSSGLLNGVNGLADKLTKSLAAERQVNGANGTNGEYFSPNRPDTVFSIGLNNSRSNGGTAHDYPVNPENFQAKPGHSKFVAQAGTLVADLLTCAGADHVRYSILL